MNAFKARHAAGACGPAAGPWVRRGCCLMLGVSLAAPALPQGDELSREVRFQIDSQPLALALIEFSDQARVQVVSSGAQVRSLTTPGVVGKHRIVDALQAILQGTGLKFMVVNQHTISIGPAPCKALPADDAARLAAASAGDDSSIRRQMYEQVLEAIEVTATLVVRDGYEAPTPTTVMGAEAIDVMAPANIADAVNALPSLAGSATPRTGSTNVSGGQAGTNAVDLRSMGANRTLVLLDGKRVVAQSLAGVVDVNQLPDGLIERIDVVTGGASAAYGSDAMSGVVNFVIDTDFTGFRTSFMGGATTHGDDEQYKTSIAAGTPFAGEHGHFLISADYSDVAGVTGTPRSWYRGWKVLRNPDYMPDNGQPLLLTRPNVGLSQAAPGALITSGPLQGTQFGPGGAISQFEYGSIVSDPLMAGGDWATSDIGRYGDLDGAVERAGVFTHTTFELTDIVEAFAQVSYAESDTATQCCRQFNIDSIEIKPDNAFIPDSLRDRIGAPFTIGTTNLDLGPIRTHSERSVSRYVLGATGEFGMLGADWNWEIYAQRGVSTVHNSVFLSITENYRNAIDAVRTGDGRIVCRSTLSNPDDGCVPYNVLGTGVNSLEAIDYVLGEAQLEQELIEDVAAASLTGEPFSTWAGPVSVASGVEHRRESVESDADPLAAANAYFAANFKETAGSYDVIEGFFETVAPLAAGQPGADALDLNAAVRWTNYSTSGSVLTWKAGATWSPHRDVTIRATRSRDIRAPNLNELFLTGQVNTQTINDPFRDNEVTVILRPQVGNLDLEPEQADTTGVGVVYQPSFAPGLSMSLDYYKIDVRDAIATILQQQIIDRCFAGDTALCAAIKRDASGVVTQVTVQPINLTSEIAEGLDIEASYRKTLWNGLLSVRALATHVMRRRIDDGVTVTDLAGDNAEGSTSTAEGSAADWRFLGIVGYERGSYAAALIGRGVSDGVLDNAFIECRTGCPAATTARRTIDDNHVAGAFYFDLSLLYRPAHAVGDMELFLKVENLADKPPAVVPGTGTLGFIDAGANPLLYDTVGRTVRAGMRLRW